MTNIILSVSVILQFSAAYLALRMTGDSRRRWAWRAVALAIFLMGVRRSVTLYHAIGGVADVHQHFAAELVSLLISILMLVGVAALGSVFHSMQKSRENLSDSLTSLNETKLQFETLNQTLEDERNMFISGNVVVFKWRNAPGWPVEYVSPNIEALQGYSQEDYLSGKITIQDVVYPEDIKRISAEIEDARQSDSRQASEGDYRVKCKNGKTIWMRSYTTLVRDDEGKITHRLGYATDITERKEAEEKLAESELRFRTLVDNAPEAILIYCHECRQFVDFNDNALKLLGLTREQLEQSDLPEISAEKQSDGSLSKDLVRQYVRRAREESICRFEWLFQHSSGKTITCDVQIVPLPGEADLQLRISATDISERKNTEDTLASVVRAVSAKVGDEFLETIAREMAQACGAKYAMVVEIADSDCSLARTLVVRDGDATVDNFEYELAGTPCESVIRNGICHYSENVATLFPEDKLLVEMKVESYLGVPFFDSADRPLGFLAVLHTDRLPRPKLAKEVLTILAARTGAEIERIRSDRFLRESEKRLTEAQRIAHLGYWSWDIEQDLVYWSDEIFRIFGISPTTFEANYEAFLSFVHPEDLDMVKDSMVQTLEQGQPYKLDHRIVLPDGQIRHVHEQAEVIRDDSGAAIRMVGTVVDITRRKLLEAERIKSQKLESVGLLAGGIAHDFNNILTVLIGNLNLMRTCYDDRGLLDECLDSADEATHQASQLTQQLLTFARGGTPVKKAASVAKLLRECAGLAVRGSNVLCRVTDCEDTLASEIDSGQISQVLNNLILNAVQAMPEGGEIVVSAERVILEADQVAELKSGEWVKFSVSDSGSGITPENLPKIFDPYFTTKTTGSGLGLAGAHSIIGNHGGAITVATEVNVGSTFTVYLPILETEIVELVQKTKSVTPGEFSGKILVMDDEGYLRDIANRSLKMLGFEVVGVADGEGAIIEFIRARQAGAPFDVIILDLTVPGSMGGVQALKRILELDPQVKAIVSSGYNDDPIMANYRDHGFCDILPKPYKLEDLRSVLQSVLNSPLQSSKSSRS